MAGGSFGATVFAGGKQSTGGGGSGPPFATNSAINGLSVDASGKIVFGQDIGDVLNPAQLISPREIPLNGNRINFGSATDPLLFGIGYPGIVVADGAFTSVFFEVTPPSYGIGDLSAITNGTALKINDTLKQVSIGDNGTANDLIFIDAVNHEFEVDLLSGFPYLQLQAAIGVYSIGDISSSSNGNQLQINDTGQQVTQFISGMYLVQTTLGQTLISLDSVAGNYIFGNQALANLQLSDSNTSWSLRGGPNDFLEFDGTNSKGLWQILGQNALDLDVNNKTYKMGAAPTFNYIMVDDGNNVFAYLNGTGAWLSVNSSPGTDNFFLGDPSGNYSITGIGAAHQITVQATTVVAQVGAGGFKVTGDTTLIHSGTALANHSGAGLATLSNSPSNGNPTKWIIIDDNGTSRYIPTWT